MLIKFNDHDPRAGTVARMDSTRGQQLVDAYMKGLASKLTGAKIQPRGVWKP